MKNIITNYLMVHATIFCVIFDLAIIAGPFINPEPTPPPVSTNAVIPLSHN
jgi:tellurite resistance protein TehA-like permease